jgi:PleD family two-component response regulator
MQESAFKAGYSNFVTKPIDPRKFPAQIAEIIRQHKLQRSSEAV